MAEFQEVMRQYVRLCESQENCSHCPVYRFYGCFNTVKRVSECNDADMFERTIMEWAAEHPEPVYPTWWEYLYEIGGMQVVSSEHYSAVRTCLSNPIPADIAEKLGIEPKEG